MSVTINQLPAKLVTASQDEAYLEAQDKSYKASLVGLSRPVIMAKGSISSAGDMYPSNFGFISITRISHGVYEYVLEESFDPDTVQIFAWSKWGDGLSAYAFANNKIRLIQTVSGSMFTGDNGLLVLRPAS